MLHRNYFFTTTVCLVLLCTSICAQETLSLQDAIKRSLEKNNQVLIYKNQAQIASLQNNAGNAGMLPTVGANASYNFSSSNAHFEFSNGTEQNRNGALANNFGASVYASWTVFDGMKMFAVKKRLVQNEQLSQLSLKQQLELTVFNTMAAYYNVVRVNELMKAARLNLLTTQTRKKISDLRYEIGSASNVDVLIAKNEENKAQSVILQLEVQLLSAKSDLNVLMNRETDIDFSVNDSIVLTTNEMAQSELKKTASGNNLTVLFSKQNEVINEQLVKETRSLLLPQIQLNGAYNFTRNQSQAGFVFLNRQSGPQAGISANWLFYSGGKNKRLIEEKSVVALNQRLITEMALRQTDALVTINYKKHELGKKMLKLELENVIDSKELLDISLERFSTGKSGIMESIEAQKALQDARVNYINVLYTTKLAETELLRAKGELVK